MREAIDRHRAGLDADPIGYWHEHEEKQEAKVLQAAADYLCADPMDIALTDSTTMGLGLLYGGLALRPGQEILTTTTTIIRRDFSALRAERTGAPCQITLYRSLKTVSRDEIVDSLRKGVTPATRIVAVTWVHSSTGLKLPIREMALAIQSINRSRSEQDRVIFCVDGVHALGVEDFCLRDLGCDFLIAGTHKWMFGPRGTGLVWGHPKAWPIAQAIIPTFNTQAYDLWMENRSASDLPPSIHMTPGGFHSFEHRWALDEAFRFHRVSENPGDTAYLRIESASEARLGGHVPSPSTHRYHRIFLPGSSASKWPAWSLVRWSTHLRQHKIVGSVTPTRLSMPGWHRASQLPAGNRHNFGGDRNLRSS